MTLPPELRTGATHRFRPEKPVAVEPTPEPVAPAPAEVPAGASPREAVVRRARGAAKRAALPVLRRAAPIVRRWAAESAQSELMTTRQRIAELERRLDEKVGDDEAFSDVRERLRANEINQVLQKAQFADVLHRFEDLGTAIAPGAGIGAASVRLSEQREHLHSLDRRLRVLDERVSSATLSPEALEGAGGSGAEATEPVPGFDYIGFERRFRGDPEEILRVQRERYVPILSGHGPVVDVGCGRGELLQALTAEGVECLGVEPEPGMAAEAKSYGLTVEQTDALGFLREREAGSVGAIFSAHVVEHLQLDYLLEFIHLSASRLQPGGLFVAETPNPASLIVLGNSYILDPTHVWPLHPSLMAFLCESAGFRDVELRFHAPATGYQLATPSEDSDLARVVHEGFSRLNDVLFGPQDYTIIATKGSD